jgi:hypothetical protein
MAAITAMKTKVGACLDMVLKRCEQF